MKKSFEKKSDATARALAIAKERGDQNGPKRGYLCEKCGKWHLTSISKKRWQNVASPEARRKRWIQKVAAPYLKKWGIEE